MNVGLTATTRDLALSAPAQTAVAAVSQPPEPAAERQDTFGPATRVAISSAADTATPSPARARPASDAVQTVISVDPDTKALVYQARDEQTGSVLSQYPDEAKLRLRAYIDELTQQQTQTATAGTHPDPAGIDGIRI